MILTDGNFDSIVNENKLILVDFWAPWCGPCLKMAPILDDLEKESAIPVGKLNIDENRVKTEEYGISSIPTMVLFMDGKPVHTIIGAKPKHLMIKELSEWL